MAQILVVEDEESLLQTLRYNLSRAGHEVRLSTNGLQALDMIRGSPPELVVLDLMLPGLDGLELCRAVRAETNNPAVAHVPILMLTARDEEIDKDVGPHRVHRGDAALQLKRREFDLLVYFLRHPGQLQTREALLRNVWGYEYVGDTRTVDVHVRWLRGKIEPDPTQPARIQTVRGIGYVFQE